MNVFNDFIFVDFFDAFTSQHPSVCPDMETDLRHHCQAWGEYYSQGLDIK